MTTSLGKSCSFGLPRVPFENCCQFMYLVVSVLVLRAGCGICISFWSLLKFLLYSMSTCLFMTFLCFKSHLQGTSRVRKLGRMRIRLAVEQIYFPLDSPHRQKEIREFMQRKTLYCIIFIKIHVLSNIQVRFINLNLCNFLINRYVPTRVLPLLLPDVENTYNYHFNK